MSAALRSTLYEVGSVLIVQIRDPGNVRLVIYSLRDAVVAKRYAFEKGTCAILK